MCHSTDSRPPAPPNPGEVAEHGRLELTAADGNRFAAHHAVPATPNGRSVVILPDIRGLHPYYEDLTQRFAEAGFHAVALDYFGRTAGIGARDDSFDWQAHIGQVTPDQVRTDVAAAVDWLREHGAGAVFTVGFCFGGSQSWRLSASDLDLAGVIGFYGKPELVDDVVDDFGKPLLLLIAGADVATPQAEFRQLADRLSAAGKDFAMHVYDGAPHSFFDRSFGDWRDACADAWRRILDFTGHHA
ncbi:dienelactone hydrolase family protein [Goodfellowiella coeruleoviolacea]|uniref:Carboxymethylenebutenolidase n=1 Tax=Goodfellowiella coeruleoviolacea TaxID=334858 RepID=A0AAE3GEY8_9PSEU|nr:dienelactone hydrolase family protein [Goodfellowiella coeruleoviolacea]MCP2164908.1 carboxymethylenebutenolidase [Goodfellowiella coeruleoviolacea]